MNAMDETIEDHRQPTLRARVPEPMMLAVDATAAACGTTRSTAVRELLIFALSSRGLWPPREAAAAP